MCSKAEIVDELGFICMNKLNESFTHPSEILVVDDTPDNLRLLLILLRQAGYSVRCATSGEKALRSIQSSLPDLILLDVMMPNMEVIFVSAMAEKSQMEKVLAAGGISYIRKSYKIQDVLSAVQVGLENALEQKSQRHCLPPTA